MQEKRKATWKLAVLIPELLLEIILTLNTAGLAISFYVQDGDLEMTIVSLILAVCFALGCSITIGGFVRYKKGKENILLAGLGMKALVAWMGLGMLMFMAGVPVLAVFLLIAEGGVIAVMVCSHFSSVKKKKESEKRAKEWAEMLQKMQFSEDKAKWRWDAAAEEYCRLYHKTPEELSGEDNGRIYEYAGGPIAYFLAWIIRHDFYSEEFLQEHGMQEIEAIKTETGSPVELLACGMDYVLRRENLSEQILPFVNYYYESSELKSMRNGRPRTERMRTYEDDYYAVVRNPQRLFYCIDFSWAVYHKIEERLDRRYQYHLIEREEYEDIPDDMPAAGEVRWELLDRSLELRVSESVPQAYVERCVQHLNCLSDAALDRICSRILESFEDAEEISGAEENSRLVLNRLYCGSIRIFPPHGEEPAYVLGFECDFEEEHGISWTMRGEEVLDMGYRMDATSPWNYENEMKYQMAIAVRNILVENIDTEEKALPEAAKGTLVTIPGVTMKSDGEASGYNQIFVPRLAADLKNEYDIMTERLLLQGMADDCQWNLTYKPGSIIPSQLRVQATKGERLVFVAYVNIW